MGTGFSKKKKQAKLLQNKLMEMQENLKIQEFRGQAGNGLVEVIVSGDNKIKSLKINPQCVDPEDVEGLEDLIKAAFQQVFDKQEEQNPSTNIDLGANMPDLQNLMKGLGL